MYIQGYSKYISCFPGQDTAVWPAGSAPKLFTAVADALEWVVKSFGVEWCIHYIDDFLTARVGQAPRVLNPLGNYQSSVCNIGLPIEVEES